ncbi:orotidine-5'-phosphate decarboxylase [Paenisporosarcina quisquiliarum]|uniref:Orotidine 5'-phosphate decarboxylase n=1 Tax=Paenisporosarcina quisquiliarum TaxID=365346 RepID=A0A9X3LER0_9BACL|nr:orotidine-5'-phosphate decarboxylase [Paenisporosarcina quisquiliarum]MCZ8535581.1 orotidine-5'-phosphate decarboxylase [Paenisporosarcina quisquiliarum]
MNNRNPIIALDFSAKEEVLQFLKPFDEKLFVKVGMELYLQEGPTIVTDLKEMGHDVFLDLKLHDIPNTVQSAMRGLAKLGADLVNVHAAGGLRMMESALEGLEAGTEAGKQRPLLIAVTQLTSTSEQQMKSEQKINLSLQESVIHYAELSKRAGLDGVVCSVLEAADINKFCGEDFLRVTPGIRLSDSTVHDQIRIATPEVARSEGSSLIVVGRAITQSENPVETYQLVKQQWEVLQ